MLPSQFRFCTEPPAIGQSREHSLNSNVRPHIVSTQRSATNKQENDNGPLLPWGDVKQQIIHERVSWKAQLGTKKKNNAAHHIWHSSHHSYLVLVEMHSARCSITKYQEVILIVYENLQEAPKSLCGGPGQTSGKLPGCCQLERLVATRWALT